MSHSRSTRQQQKQAKVHGNSYANTQKIYIKLSNQDACFHLADKIIFARSHIIAPLSARSCLHTRPSASLKSSSSSQGNCLV